MLLGLFEYALEAAVVLNFRDDVEEGGVCGGGSLGHYPFPVVVLTILHTCWLHCYDRYCFLSIIPG